jgi:hypothetical protein
MTQVNQTITQQPVAQKQFDVLGKYMYLYTSKNSVSIKPPFMVVVGDTVYVKANGHYTYPASNDLSLNITIDGVSIASVSNVNDYQNKFIIK